MILFWLAAAVLAGGAALLVMLFARRAVGTAGAENPAIAVHRRQLSEIDDLAHRGLLGEGDQASARAEAGRRLLTSAAMSAAPETAGTATSRRIAAGIALAAAAGALALYFLLGAPGAPDQPYKARIDQWRRSDPSTLDASRMAAVLQSLAATRPTDPEVFGFLGRADMAAGDPFAAQKAYARAAALAPGRADLQVALGESLIAGADGKVSVEARAAFQRALAIDPSNLAARYVLGRAEILSGDRTGGLALWRAMLGELPASDVRRASLAAVIDRVAAGGPIDAPVVQAPAQAQMAPGGDASAFIRAMVAKQAADLAANPDYPEGWARLVRSYGVLHDAAGQAEALARARKQFAAKPAALKAVEAEAAAHPAS